MNREARLRATLWAGALVDGVVAVGLLSPALLARALALPGAPSGVETRTALGVAAALMAGWTGLLAWAARRPLERRGVLLLTVPVIAGLALAVLYGWINDYIATPAAAAIWSVQALLSALMLWAYATSGPS